MIRKKRKGHIRKITKTGQYTFYVTFPKGLVDELGWRGRQRVLIRKVNRKLVMTAYRPRKSRVSG